MTVVKTFALAAALAVGVTTVAIAAPTGNAVAPDPAGLAPAGIVTVHYKRHHRRSYGTGYNGRGTRTGGPVGGLPSRN